MAISKQQSMRPAEIELIDASNQHESTLQAHAQSLETLDKNLTTETTDRKSADTALGTRIDNEAQARTDADNALGTRIDGEVQSRTDADAALGTRIDNEVQARTDADTALGTRIDSEVAARTDADTALGTRIDDEVQSRTDADAALGTRIDSEVAARTDADAALGTRIDEVIDSALQKSVFSSLTSLDDLPLKGFGLVENIASDIRPDSGVGSALYLSFGEGESRAVMLLRYGQTQAWLNTRNTNGWHGWKALV